MSSGTWRFQPRPPEFLQEPGKALLPGATRWRRRAEFRAPPGKRWQRQKPQRVASCFPPFYQDRSRHPGRENRGPNLTSLPPSGPSTPDPSPGTPGSLDSPSTPDKRCRATPPPPVPRSTPEGTGPARAQSQAPGARRTQTKRPVPTPTVRGPEGWRWGGASDSEVPHSPTSGPLYPRLPLPGLHRLRASS